MSDREWAPPGVDPNKPNIARVYDYALGGKDNFAVDRELHTMVLQVAPEAEEVARANRAFLRRVVRHLVAETGVRQFLDIGSGLPTQGNVHEIAQEVEPTARVVYVDNDPVVLVHARALPGVTGDATAVITADLRHPEEILGDATVRNLIDFDAPVGLLLLAILHHLNDDERPDELVTQLRAVLPPGSHLAISHFHNPGDARPDDARQALESERLFAENLGTGRFRTREEILAYFGDFDMLEPGLVPLPQWRPDAPSSGSLTAPYYTFVGGVARKSTRH